MAKRRIDADERLRRQAESEAHRRMLQARIDYHQQKLAEEQAAREEWEARRARRAARIHRILTLGLGRAA